MNPVIQTLMQRDNLSWQSAQYEFVQTKKALDRAAPKGYSAKVKTLEAYMGLEEDYLPYFEQEF